MSGGFTIMVADSPTFFGLLKTVVDSARQWRTVEDNGSDLPTVLVIVEEVA